MHDHFCCRKFVSKYSGATQAFSWYLENLYCCFYNLFVHICYTKWGKLAKYCDGRFSVPKKFQYWITNIRWFSDMVWSFEKWNIWFKKTCSNCSTISPLRFVQVFWITLWYIGFLLGLSVQKSLYSACCCTKMTHEPVWTSSAKQTTCAKSLLS